MNISSPPSSIATPRWSLSHNTWMFPPFYITIFPERPVKVRGNEGQTRPRISANSQPNRWRTGAMVRHLTNSKDIKTQIMHRDHGRHHPASFTQRHCHSSATAGPNSLKINDDKVHTSFYNSLHFQRRCFVFRSSRYYYVHPSAKYMLITTIISKQYHI